MRTIRVRAVGEWGGRLLREVESATTEAALSTFYHQRRASGHNAFRYSTRHPVRVLCAAVAVARLPLLRWRAGGGVESKVIEEALKVPLFRVLRSSWIGMSVLAVPGTQSDYLSGARKQTLRRKIRAAQRDGVTYRRIEDPVERRELLALADRVEMEHSDPNYRNSRPQNAGILGHRFWLGGFGPSGEPLLLAVLPIANGAAYLRYFRTLGHGNTFSNARYMLSAAMVEELRKEGVSFVFDGTPPSYLPNGLRDFQRMVGFRAMRVRLVRRSARPASGAVRQVPRAGAFAVSRQEQQEGELIQ